MKTLRMKILTGLLLLVSAVAVAQNGPNWYGQALASAARGASANSADITNAGYRGVHLMINVTACSTCGSWTPHIQGKDPVTGVYYDLLVGSAITTVGSTVLKVYPGITASANLSASDIVPRTWRAQMVTPTTPASMTFSVTFSSEY